MGNKVNELLSSLKEINCQIFDREPESCKFWVNKGECNLNPTYMHRECRWACGLCHGKEDLKFRNKN